MPRSSAGRERAASPEPLVDRVVGSTSGRLALLLGFAALLLAGTAAVGTAVGDFPDFGEALWSGIRHLLDPGSLGDDETTSRRIVGLIEVLTGIVLVVGLALTVLSDVVDRLLHRLGESDPPVRTSGHLLVIGAGAALVPVLRRLAEREPDAVAVVCVPPGDAADRRGLQERLVAATPRLAVRVIGGDASSEGGLARAAATAARAIAVLSPANVDDDAADVHAIEIGAALAEALAAAGHATHVGVELRRGRNVDAIWSQFPDNFDAVVRDRSLGAVLTIAISQPSFVAALGVTPEGDEGGIFVVDAAPYAGARFAALLDLLDDAIPIGLVPGGDFERVRYAPDPATAVGPGDRLIVIADDEPAARRQSAGPAAAARRAAAGPPYPARVELLPSPRGLIVGWSDAAASLLAGRRSLPGPHPRLSVLAAGDALPAPAEAEGDGIERRIGDPGDPRDLAAAIRDVDPGVVLVTATGARDDDRAADARAALTALHICRIVGERRLPLLVEQRLADRERPLARADDRIRVISGAALAGQTIGLAVVDPDALAAQEALARHPVGSVRTADLGIDAGSFAAAYRALLAAGAVPIGLARGGAALPRFTATTALEPADELLVIKPARPASVRRL